MCGIIALYSGGNDVNKERLALSAKQLSHRGPDEEGFWISPDKKIALAHRRLNIIDPLGGKQPLKSRDETIIASINGEFYDYQKMRACLEGEGYKFLTKSDNEIVIPLYQKYGLNFVKYLRGEFAIVLYDDTKKLLVAARDRFGIKPLHYHLDNKNTLYIGSEAKALLALGLRARWDTYSLYHALSLQYTPQDRTLFQDIFQLKPGHLLIYNGSKLKIKKYWDLDFPKEKTQAAKRYHEEAIANELETLLKEAVFLRLQTDDAKYCAHLSGGVDSALVSAIAAKMGRQKLHCFTVSFPHESYDEAVSARKITKHIGADFTEVTVDPSLIIKNLEDAVYYSEGLAINSHLAAKYILNKEIRRAGYKIALTGEGSDESLAGYIHLKADLLNTAVEDGAGVQNTIVGGVHFPLGRSINLKIIQERLGFVPTFLQAKGSIGYALSSILQPQFKKKYSHNQIVIDFINSMDIKNQLIGRNKADQSSYIWIKFALANYILKTLGDGTEMASSIEGRVPFLDHKFFEFARTIPVSLKIKNDTQKYILRKIAKKYLPQEVYERSKQTFMAPPLSLSSDKIGISFLRDTFSSKEFAEMGFFDQDKALSLLKNLDGAIMQKHIMLEPVIMLLLSSFLIHKKFKLSL